MKRLVLSLTLLVILAGTALAFEKEEPVVPGKDWQNVEPYWNPNPGEGIMAVVPEDESRNNTCPGQPFNCGDVLRPAGIQPAGDVDYFYFTANAGDYITLGTDSILGTPIMDTKAYIFNADCSVQLAYDDDSGPGFASLITNYLACYTGTYVGKITGFSATTVGTYKAFVNCAPSGIVDPGYGDTCANATALPCGPVDLAGHTACYTNNYTPPAPSCTRFSAGGKDIVFALNVNAGASVNLAYQSTTDASIYIYDSCDPQHCVVGDDSTGTNGIETIQYTFPNTGTYYLILDSWSLNTSGAWTLRGTFDCGPVAVETKSWAHFKRMYH